MPLSPRDVASLVGRNQAPEKFITAPFVAGGSNPIQRTFNLTRPAESIDLTLRIRARFVDASMTTIAAEAPQSLLQRFRITGTHRVWSNMTPCDMTGASMFTLNRLYNAGRGNSVYMSTNGGPVRRLPNLSTPIQTLVPGVTFGKQNDFYDLEIHWSYPLDLLFPPQVKGSVTPLLWFPQDFSDTIQFQPFFGDAASFGSIVADGGDVIFSDYGSDTGAGTLEVSASYVILGSLANAVQSAVVVRGTSTVNAQAQSIGNYILLNQLQKQKTTNVIVKSGSVFTTGLQPGVQVYETLSDTMLGSTMIVVDNKRFRDNQNNMAMKEFVARMFASMAPQGYLPLTFVDSQNPLTNFRGDNVPGGSTFGVYSDVTTSGVAQQVEIIQEQIFGDPGINFAQAARAAA